GFAQLGLHLGGLFCARHGGDLQHELLAGVVGLVVRFLVVALGLGLVFQDRQRARAVGRLSGLLFVFGLLFVGLLLRQALGLVRAFLLDALGTLGAFFLDAFAVGAEAFQALAFGQAGVGLVLFLALGLGGFLRLRLAQIHLGDLALGGRGGRSGR